MYDVMIDLENLGIEPDCAVLTIGCVQFDIHTGKLGSEFYERIDRVKAQKYGRTSISTMQWWESQNPETRAEAYDGTADPVAVSHALREWFTRTFDRPPFVWGNGSLMDIAQLEWFLRNTTPEKDRKGNFCYPWKYWDVMDMRTIMRVAKMRMPNKRPEHVQHHNALHDARYQAEWVCKAMAAIRAKPAALPHGLPPMPPAEPEEPDFIQMYTD